MVVVRHLSAVSFVTMWEVLVDTEHAAVYSKRMDMGSMRVLSRILLAACIASPKEGIVRETESRISIRVSTQMRA